MQNLHFCRIKNLKDSMNSSKDSINCMKTDRKSRILTFGDGFSCCNPIVCPGVNFGLWQDRLQNIVSPAYMTFYNLIIK
jgi:hypothetical protein